MSKTVIDYRSDTFTQPTPAMRKALSEAEVGDDVFGEDPTINRLQDMAAELTGKEAALFVPSGTMGNLVSLLTHCQRGDEVILGDQSHIFLNEVGGMAALGGIQPNPLPNRDDGTLDPRQVEAGIRVGDVHHPQTRLICLENTHNYCYGSPLTPEFTSEIRSLADRHELKIHLDGARLFNAAVALGQDVCELTQHVDSVMFCLSKGLSAPVGSLVCGKRDWIGRARKWRKMLGGGMRQAGVLAAAGIEALTHQIEPLKNDHENARMLGQGLASMPGVAIDLNKVQTNILFFGLDHPALNGASFVERLEEKGVKILLLENGLYRAVLNRHISAADVDTTLKIVRELLG